MDDFNRILAAIESGDPEAAAQLLPLVYDELRALAAQRLKREPPGQTLQATALVHEAYLRLVGSAPARGWDGRAHFFAAASEAMRRILVENARRKKRQKRGGELQRVELADDMTPIGASVEDVLALDEALEQLAQVDRQAAELVKLRHFSGLSTEEAGEMLGISSRTAYRTWKFARAWLYRHLHPDAGTEDLRDPPGTG
jgi:RNA polymerase sigma factor (TIGR02999 family)